MIASHYVEPLPAVLTIGATLRASPAADGEPLLELEPGVAFEILQNSRGWVWGYAGPERRVGYVRSEAVSPA